MDRLVPNPYYDANLVDSARKCKEMMMCYKYPNTDFYTKYQNYSFEEKMEVIKQDPELLLYMGDINEELMLQAFEKDVGSVVYTEEPPRIVQEYFILHKRTYGVQCLKHVYESLLVEYML